MGQVNGIKLQLEKRQKKELKNYKKLGNILIFFKIIKMIIKK